MECISFEYLVIKWQKSCLSNNFFLETKNLFLAVEPMTCNVGLMIRSLPSLIYINDLTQVLAL